MNSKQVQQLYAELDKQSEIIRHGKTNSVEVKRAEQAITNLITKTRRAMKQEYAALLESKRGAERRR